jgi:uncharacterized repeat protein (TIGR01451 family)
MKNHMKKIISQSLFTLLVLFILPLSNASAAPTVTSPASGSTLPLSTQTFTWSANGTAGITQWWFQLGSGTSFTNIYSGSQGTNTSITINGLPTNGSTINLRLWYRIGSWQNITFSYTSCNGCTPTATDAVMTSPVNGSTFIQPTQVFTWQAINGIASQYWLFIGTGGAGSSNIYSGSQGTNTQSIRPNMPTNGSTVFVRLWYRVGNTWKNHDYIYTSCTGCTISPILTMKKESFLVSDPISGMSNPKNIPGAIVKYIITATNSGFGSVDANSIVINDSIPAGTSYEAGTLAFTNNTSGLNASATLNASGGNIQVTPQGTFSASNGITHPFFQVEFQVKIQ